MARSILEKTTFSAGELAPELWGRGDIAAYRNGAAKLRNVFVQPSGGVCRRPGVRLIDEVSGPVRLVPFEYNVDQPFLLVFWHLRATVYAGDVVVQELTTPFEAKHLPQISWTQSADTLLVVHPDVMPIRIVPKADADWLVTSWVWGETNVSRQQPYYKFAEPYVSIKPSGTGGTISLVASEDVFVAGHVGLQWRIRGVEGKIDSVSDGKHAKMTLRANLPDAGETQDFAEPAFSAVRGWPRSVTFHQDRMVIGGSRDLPNRLWLSHSGDLFNFELGEGLDDEAIEFALLADQVSAISAVFSGRDLQVFTSGAEWMVSGTPLTPQNIQVTRQTRIGSAPDRNVPPVNIDGATVFAARNGGEMREFLFTDLEQAYGSADLALLSGHLIHSPVDQAYDANRRLLHVVMGDGSLATLTLYRSEGVTAWSRQETDGYFRNVAVSGSDVYLAIERDGRFFLGRFDDGLGFDLAIAGSAAVSQERWGQFGLLDGMKVAVWADGQLYRDVMVEGGNIGLASPARTIVAGLPFRHEIAALPPVGGDGSRPYGGACLRLVSATFRLHDSAGLAVDVGRGMRAIPLHKPAAGRVLDQAAGLFRGDITVRAMGWKRGGQNGLWRIEGDVPGPFVLLGVSSEVGVND
ncbi:hypothetical protein [Thalassospira sp. TSL5-1]|uniref:hypothetical protein n=1 Tax=Thalassospira sp. TSL5-1 TaxID=1544451 RepID=UPI00093B399C|nr:hypothetical protein [Thalassospira sp. TSL5-1]OKH89129.1 hypothetical protein LF95_03520 [Thalassospira sp. TSL5-1]